MKTLAPILALCVLVGLASGQTKEEIKQQAESQLRTMSADDITQKLKDLGISREEAVRRAADYGISLEDYLGRASGSQTAATLESLQTGATFQSDPRIGLLRQIPTSLQKGKYPIAAAPIDSTKPLKPVVIPGFTGRRGVDTTIQPLGYEMFEYPASAYTPTAAAATPPSYALGPGDELLVSVWGETKLNYQITVNREGNLIVPDVGPITANGLTVAALKDRLLKKMSAYYSSLRNGAANAGSYLDVSLGKLKTIQVFVMGEVRHPAGYSLPSMAGPMSALYAAGGILPEGSLRSIQIIRKGERLPDADLYGFIVRGDRSAEIALQDGDIVYVTPAVRRVAVIGEVIHPAIVEIKENEGLGDALALAGGLRFDAYFERIHVERIVPFSQRLEFKNDLLEFDWAYETIDALLKSRERLEAGDVIQVLKVGERAVNRASIRGNVKRPGPFELKQGMRIRDLILAADSLNLDTFVERGSVFRLLPDLRREIMPFNPRLALAGDPRENLLLKNEDTVEIYKESDFFPRDYVVISGAVNRPGKYQRNERMTVADLIVVAGGACEWAQMQGIEIGRMDTSKLGVYSHTYRVDLPDDYWNSRDTTNLVLHPYDYVSVPNNPKYMRDRVVTINGYVMRPGTYSIRYEGERLSELFDRAGGLRPGAFLEGTHLIRKSTKAGLIPLDFKKALSDPSSRDNISLWNEDSIYVAFLEDVVFVSGEVTVASPVLYRKGASLGFYIDQAGGYKQEADEGRTVVMLPGGKKYDGGGIFSSEEILPGSTIYVPKKIEKPDTLLPILRDLVTILASLAAMTVAVAQLTK